MRQGALRQPQIVALLVACGVGLNIALGVAIGRGMGHRAALVALAPVVIAVLSWVVVSHRNTLVFVALAYAIFGAGPLGDRLPGTGGTTIYITDLLVLLALGAWIVARLLSSPEDRPAWPRTPVLSWPLLAFAVAMLLAIVRGHDRYGAPYIGQPARMVFYAGIAAAVAGMTAQTAYRGVVAVFYAGAVWQALLGVYYLATGTSQTPSEVSTGGTRALALSTAMFLAGSLVLALLNLDRDGFTGRWPLHVAIAALATFGIVVSLGRTTFAAVGVLVPVFFIALRRMRRSLLSVLPLFIPAILLCVLILPQAAPSFGKAFEDRLTGAVRSDASLIGRERKFHAVLDGFGEEPIRGLGFGRTVRVENIDRSILFFSGDPENSYIYLLAGGGFLALGTFILLVLSFYLDAFRRLLRSHAESRALVAWGASMAFILLVNTLTGPVLTNPTLLLTLWIAFLLPALARPAAVPRGAASAHGGDAPLPDTGSARS
jgi:O-Antigen ligase